VLNEALFEATTRSQVRASCNPAAVAKLFTYAMTIYGTSD